MAALTASPGALRAECVTFRVALFLESLEPVRGREEGLGTLAQPCVSSLCTGPLHLLTQLPEPFPPTQLFTPPDMTDYLLSPHQKVSPGEQGCLSALLASVSLGPGTQ